MSEDKTPITGEAILKILNSLYDKTKTGIPYVSKPVEMVAEEYLKKYPNRQKAAQKMLNAQIAKCATSGFITGFGGVITMPITIPADLSSVLYVQMRMIACAACIGGYELDDDEIRTFVFACLAGISVADVAKKFGVKIGKKIAEEGVKKIPGKLLISINKKVGFRLVTKFGEKGIINIGKMIPIVGAVINGGFDLGETKLIANRAYKMFIKKSISSDSTHIVDAYDVNILDNEQNLVESDSKNKESLLGLDVFK